MVIICSRHYTNEIKKFYADNNILSIGADILFNKKLLLLYESLLKVFSYDKKSKVTLLNLIKILSTGKLTPIDHLEKNMYFSPPEFFFQILIHVLLMLVLLQEIQ